MGTQPVRVVCKTLKMKDDSKQTEKLDYTKTISHFMSHNFFCGPDGHRGGQQGVPFFGFVVPSGFRVVSFTRFTKNFCKMKCRWKSTSRCYFLDHQYETLVKVKSFIEM